MLAPLIVFFFCCAVGVAQMAANAYVEWTMKKQQRVRHHRAQRESSVRCVMMTAVMLQCLVML